MSETMTDEMKPCPGCAGSDGNNLFVDRNADGWWQYQCECGWRAPFAQTKRDAFAAWNTRALQQPSEGEVERWQPIETAPKDGTPVLLGYFRENFDGSIYEEGGEPVVARWIGRFRDTTGWVARRERLNSEGSFSPSHWRPCPKPPTAIAAMRGEGE